MPTPTEIVTEFLARWERPGEIDNAFRDAFTSETVWENVGMAKTTGLDEALALNRMFADKLGMVAIRVDNLAVAEAGNTVLTERIDHILNADGEAVISASVMGIFEVGADGKIIAWRDYLDSKRFSQP